MQLQRRRLKAQICAAARRLTSAGIFYPLQFDLWHSGREFLLPRLYRHVAEEPSKQTLREEPDGLLLPEETLDEKLHSQKHEQSLQNHTEVLFSSLEVLQASTLTFLVLLGEN